MRLKLAMILMLGLPAVAAAQTAARVPATGSVVPPLPPIGLPLPQIGLPLPEIGLPLSSIGLPPPAAAPEHRDGVKHPVPGNRRPHRSVVYLFPAYGLPFYQAPTAGAPTASPDGSSTSRQRQPLAGHLRIDIEPDGAEQQLYVDSYYVGTVKDFSGEVELDAGPHTIAIQAPGYETLHVDVSIAPGRSITYRGTLKAAEPKPATEPAVPSSTSSTAATPMTIYTVPGCYIGNVPPQDAGLPASCDVGRVITSQR
jgi:hypothetical protein